MINKKAFLALCAIFSAFVASARAETVMFGDMLVDSGDIMDDFGQGLTGAVKFKVQPWVDGVLPVVFSKGTTPGQKKLFFEACAVWERAAGVSCIEGPYLGRHIKVTHAKLGCWSLWGMGYHFVALRRRMNLQAECWSAPTIMHELGHAFGLIHEHQRPDRDEYVTIHSENLAHWDLGINATVNLAHQKAVLLTPYDFRSIMHYPRWALTKNGRDTIVPKPAYREFIDIIGLVPTISELDARAMAAIYGPPKH